MYVLIIYIYFLLGSRFAIDESLIESSVSWIISSQMSTGWLFNPFKLILMHWIGTLNKQVLRGAIGDKGGGLWRRNRQSIYEPLKRFYVWTTDCSKTVALVSAVYILEWNSAKFFKQVEHTSFFAELYLYCCRPISWAVHLPRGKPGTRWVPGKILIFLSLENFMSRELWIVLPIICYS